MNNAPPGNHLTNQIFEAINARPVCFVAVALSVLALSACGNKAPVHLGDIGGVSGRTADLGIGGRNGAPLAIELANAQGGIDGRKIELLLQDDVTGEDDPFFRVVAASEFHAREMSRFLIEKRKIRQIDVVLDMSDMAYTESWLASFVKSFTSADGKIKQAVRYTSAVDFDFSATAKAAFEAQREGNVLVTSAVDAAVLINHLRQQAVKVL